ncbi:hypothetical protein ACQP2Y_21870 [Actinoplanes sp. CA-051413]|uniref:hypothetical protein n=1 Tax=Actinoplanes sp. CA-051413 TaxID=3239899 RepID=UPI003D96D5C9
MTVTDQADVMEWDDPTQYVDALSLMESQRQQRWALRAMWDAKNRLAAVRDEEVTAEAVYQSARRRAFFDPNCPVVVRGGVTTAERDAWVDQQVEDVETKWKLAKAATQAAKDHMDTLRAQSVLISALAKTTQQIHAVAGVNR